MLAYIVLCMDLP